MEASTFSYKIVINHKKNQVLVEEYSNEKKKKNPIYIGNNNPYSIAQACRIASYQLLERADGIQHSEEFYHQQNIQNQIQLMLKENSFCL